VARWPASPPLYLARHLPQSVAACLNDCQPSLQGRLLGMVKCSRNDFRNPDFPSDLPHCHIKPLTSGPSALPSQTTVARPNGGRDPSDPDYHDDLVDAYDPRAIDFSLAALNLGRMRIQSKSPW
jgi:hypothetical protein